MAAGVDGGVAAGADAAPSAGIPAHEPGQAGPGASGGWPHPKHRAAAQGIVFRAFTRGEAPSVFTACRVSPRAWDLYVFTPTYVVMFLLYFIIISLNCWTLSNSI